MSDLVSVSSTPDPAADAHARAVSLERLKSRLATRLAVTEKLLIAIIVAVGGFLLNRALETY